MVAAATSRLRKSWLPIQIAVKGVCRGQARLGGAAQPAELNVPSQLPADACRVAKNPEALKPIRRNLYKIASKAVWLCTVEAPDKPPRWSAGHADIRMTRRKVGVTCGDLIRKQMRRLDRWRSWGGRGDAKPPSRRSHNGWDHFLGRSLRYKPDRATLVPSRNRSRSLELSSLSVLACRRGDAEPTRPMR
jgi:hypothetical protein